MSKIKYYTAQELEGLSETELDHLRLVSRALDKYEDADANKLEQLSDNELLELLGEGMVQTIEPKQKPKRGAKKNPKPKIMPPERVTPRTINEAFVVVNGQLMRRHVALVYVENRDTKQTYKQPVEHLTPCGSRVRWQGRTYYSSVLIHWLTTGEQVARAPRQPKPKRYKAQVRLGQVVKHLGYFATPEERDGAILMFRLSQTIANPEGH
jgi:hypothetical protein